MENKRTVCLSSPLEKNLARNQRRVLQGVVKRVEEAGFRIVTDSDAVEEGGSTAGRGWDAVVRYARLRRCQGILVLGFAQWEARRLYRDRDRCVILPSEFTHINCALAAAVERPLLVFREKSLAERGALRRAYVNPVLNMPASVDPDWLERDAFKKPFDNWIKRVRSYKDVFLGYSSEATAVGELIKRLLENKLGLTVYDWRDFSAGETIWDSIEKAEQLTACGMFLFMADDRLQAGRKRMAAPRDNVVYEAGYYAGAKGRRYAAIIRERGAKVPTDLGGVKYLELEDRGDISPLESGLRSYLRSVLGFET